MKHINLGNLAEPRVRFPPIPAASVVAAFDPLRTLGFAATQGQKGCGFLRLIIVIGLIAVQLFVSLFYASTALAMWGPFMSAPTAVKLLIGTVVTVPVLSFLVANDRIRIVQLGKVAAVGFITTLQIALVLIFVMTSGG